MAERRVYIGSVGPYLFDDEDPINDEDITDPYYGAPQKGITSNAKGEMSQLSLTDAPTDDHDIMRKSDVESLTENFVTESDVETLIDSAVGDLSLSITTSTITVVTSIDFGAETYETSEITFVTNVELLTE